MTITLPTLVVKDRQQDQGGRLSKSHLSVPDCWCLQGYAVPPCSQHGKGSACRSQPPIQTAQTAVGYPCCMGSIPSHGQWRSLSECGFQRLLCQIGVPGVQWIGMTRQAVGFPTRARVHQQAHKSRSREQVVLRDACACAEYTCWSRMFLSWVVRSWPRVAPSHTTGRSPPLICASCMLRCTSAPTSSWVEPASMSYCQDIFFAVQTERGLKPGQVVRRGSGLGGDLVSKSPCLGCRADNLSFACAPAHPACYAAPVLLLCRDGLDDTLTGVTAYAARGRRPTGSTGLAALLVPRKDCDPSYRKIQASQIQFNAARDTRSCS